MKHAWCPKASCQVTVLAPSSGKTLLSASIASLLAAVPGNACADEKQCVIVAEARGKDAAGGALRSTTLIPLGAGGLRDAPLSSTAAVSVTVHANRSVTLVSDALIPYATLRLKPAKAAAPGADANATKSVFGGEGVGRFSDNAVLLLAPKQPVSVQLLGLLGDEEGPSITASELRERLAVDCLNCVGGCYPACTS